MAERLGQEIETQCDTPDHPEDFDPRLAELFGSDPEEHLAGDLHLAVLAFDTDGELIQNMFGGSTAAANSAIGDFVTASNVTSLGSRPVVTAASVIFCRTLATLLLISC